MKYTIFTIILFISLHSYASQGQLKRLLNESEVNELRTVQSLSELFQGQIVAVQNTSQEGNPWVRAKLVEIINGAEVFCRLQLTATQFITVNVHDVRQLPDLQT